MVFRGLCFTPKLPSESNLPRISLGAVLATASVANKFNLVLAHLFVLNLDCLQKTVLPVFSLGTN